MTEQRRFPYGGVPVYNPQSLSKTEALAQFHARQAAYLSLMDLLHEERPSHVLIIGTRGMGKTTLLQRVRYGVEEDAELNSRYLVLAYPEEQYNVNRLHRFLLNTVDALAVAMERLKNQRMLERVEEYVGVVRKCTPEEIEERVPQFLAEITQQMQKSLLLLVDNADRLFEVIEDRQQWRLRDLLSSRRDLTFFGATTQASDGIYGPERAFFEFFKIHRLAPLTFVEVRDLLLRLSESVEEKEGEKGAAKRRVAEWLDADAARLRTLVQLTGGNPRTTVLLFHLVLDGLAGGAREYLEQLLDQVTPTYKGRVDELPPQAQQVLDAVAIRWDPVIAVEVAEDTGLGTSAVSTQLTRLVRQGILEKADAGDSKKALYQVAERFFNIWYLMRASRRVRAKLRWFVEFLRVFFDSDELEQMAWQRIEHYQRTWRGHPEEIETTFAYVLASGAGRDRFEEYLRQKCADTEEMWRPYLELLMETLGTKIATAVEDIASPVLRDDLGGKALAAIKTVVERDPSSLSELTELLATAGGSSPRDAVAAIQKATESEPNAFGRFASTLRKAIELEPKSAPLWRILGLVLSVIPTGRDEAETAFRKAIELDPKVAGFWFGLGNLLVKTPERSADAEIAYRKAIELDPKVAGFWFCLGSVLMKTPERAAESEGIFRVATELDPGNAVFWGALGFVLACWAGRPRDAEVAFRNSVRLGPDDSRNLRNLGVLLCCGLAEQKEAAVYLGRACQLDPGNPVSGAILAAALRDPETPHEHPRISIDAARETSFWDELLGLCQNYAPFGKILLGICDLVQEGDNSNRFARLYRAVALAQLGDFPRASVELEDALTGDPIDLLSMGQRALETFLAAAVKSGRVRDCLELIDKKEWKDAWRPIYEALRAVQAGSAEYLKRIAVEIRDPALKILRRIAPQVRDLPEREG
jgi:Flp pilus assembly protein TadD